jgi:hypothetical protein
MLADGERAQPTILAAALAQGIAEKTLRRAANDPEFSKRKDGNGGWFWSKVAMLTSKMTIYGHLAFSYEINTLVRKN